MMADSGARGSMNQIKQLAGMRGLLANTAGHTIEMPIRANYREGLNILEYFVSARGARKGLADTALRTADSGYLTRRMVDVSQDVIVREIDCGTTDGLWVSEIHEGKEKIESFRERLIGRFAVGDVVNPITGKVIVPEGKMIDLYDANEIEAAGITKSEDPQPADLPCKDRRLRTLLRFRYGKRRARPSGRVRRCHRCRVHRRARYSADHAYLPYRRYRIG